jgi:hypothetical protein
MPDLEFNLTVNPKPEGNFRPRVDVSVRIPPENYPHDPHINGIYLILPYSQLSRVSENTNNPTGNIISNYTRGFLQRRRAVGMFPNYNILLPDAVYAGDDMARKGTISNSEAFEQVRVTNWKFIIMYIGTIFGMLCLGSFIKLFLVLGMLGTMISFPLLVVSGFDIFPFRLTYYRFPLVPEGYPTDINYTINSFYLPWRDGEKPDYSDFIKEFKKIPQILEKQLSSGSRSGSTEEVTIKYDKASRFDNESGGATRQNP